MAWKPSSIGSGTVVATPATVSMIDDRFVFGWLDWGTGMGRGRYGGTSDLSGCDSLYGRDYVGCL